LVLIKPKTTVTAVAEGECLSHSRTDVTVRDLRMTLDEPVERGGTNQGFAPTETLMAALVGCTNVIAHKVAHRIGVRLSRMHVRLEADFDRRGTQLIEEVEVPFPAMRLHIEIGTDADDAAIEQLKRELAQFCPISKVIRASGTRLEEFWTVTRP
jgi:putative redox protein